jgi:hypothetical protein
VSTLNTFARFHSDRAECFKRHASNTRSPQTREMYLRLAHVEMALAKKAELVEQTEQQRPGEAEDRAATPTTPAESTSP